ncbi:caspase domain-containing protein, partial [Suillus discolor]
IGINYKRQDGELRGCVNDAWNIAEFLKSFWNYAKEDIMVLTDEPYNLKYMPTRRNILSALRWLVKDAQPGDCLFFHYSGHGGRTLGTCVCAGYLTSDSEADAAAVEFVSNCMSIPHFLTFTNAVKTSSGF